MYELSTKKNFKSEILAPPPRDAAALGNSCFAFT